MGYSTDFNGSLNLSRQLTDVEKTYINNFSGTRRMKRDVNKLMELFKGKYGYPVVPTNLLPASEGTVTDMVDNGSGEFVVPNRTALEIYGVDGEFFVKPDGNHGQTEDASIIDYNIPPGQALFNRQKDFNNEWEEKQKLIASGKCQPGLWCQWVMNEENELEWDGGEKFYYYIEWLKYLIDKFFQPWGVILNGEIEWTGEDRDDLGKIVVKDNVVNGKQGKIVY